MMLQMIPNKYMNIWDIIPGDDNFVNDDKVIAVIIILVIMTIIMMIII